MADNENVTPGADEMVDIEQEIEVDGIVERPTDKTLSIEDMAADAKATGDAINNVNQDVTDLAADLSDVDDRVETIEGWTGEDIPLSSEDRETSIYDAISGLQTDVVDIIYPVGSVYVSISATAPTFSGTTWVEIRMPATWGDLKSGERAYEEVTAADTRENAVHFYLRTE